MNARQRRALRGVAATITATLTAATAHTLAGGGAPAPLLLVAVAALAAPVAVALAGRRLSVWRTALTVVLAQLLLHVAFSLTAGLDPSAGSSHVHHGGTLLAGSALSILPSPPMLLAHVLAGALTVVLVYRGERMLHAIGRGIRNLFSPPAVVRPLAIPAAPRIAPVRVAPRPATRFTHDLSRRGPPAIVAAA